MKKFLYAITMAVVAFVMSSCLPGAEYTTQEPKIDQARHTINGQPYDNEEYRCWFVTTTTTITTSGDFADDDEEFESGVPVVETSYVWETEFMVRADMARAYYLGNYKVSGGSYVSGGSESTFTYTIELKERLTEASCNEDETDYSGE